jgi:hypothetical protein
MSRATMPRFSWKPRAADLAAVGQVLTADGNVLRCGRSVAEGAQGRPFIDRMARLTGADIAASANAMDGSGDWIVDASAGGIEAGGALAAGPDAACARDPVADTWDFESATGTISGDNSATLSASRTTAGKRACRSRPARDRLRPTRRAALRCGGACATVLGG